MQGMTLATSLGAIFFAAHMATWSGHMIFQIKHAHDFKKFKKTN
jgi:hypothetical protein